MTKSWLEFLAKLIVAAALIFWLLDTGRIDIGALGGAVADPLFFAVLALFALCRAGNFRSRLTPRVSAMAAMSPYLGHRRRFDRPIPCHAPRHSAH